MVKLTGTPCKFVPVGPTSVFAVDPSLFLSLQSR